MGIKIYKPTSAGRRNSSVNDFAELTTDRPEKSLCIRIKKSGGRNHSGMTMCRFRGGGARQIYRLIDFKRDKAGVPAVVSAIEYDPNRSSRIALLNYKDGEKRYIILPAGLNVGDEIVSGKGAEIKVGNALPLSDMPLGSFIHNIELHPGQGAKMVRSAGTSAQLIAKEENYVQVKLSSGEVRRVAANCMATIGQVGNPEHENLSSGKAGRSRWLGKRPHVRGVVMNPVDHPLGGGEGRSSGGRPPCTPWGVPEGIKTRNSKRTNMYIVKRRK